MICDGVNDLFNALIKIFLEKDETKQVYLISKDCLRVCVL